MESLKVVASWPSSSRDWTGASLDRSPLPTCSATRTSCRMGRVMRRAKTTAAEHRGHREAAEGQEERGAGLSRRRR